MGRRTRCKPIKLMVMGNLPAGCWIVNCLRPEHRDSLPDQRRVGAEIHGIDLAEPIIEETLSKIRQMTRVLPGSMVDAGATHRLQRHTITPGSITRKALRL